MTKINESQSDSLAPQVYVARQPIFDRNNRISAYELLFRSGVEQIFSGVDGARATSSVLAGSFITIGLENLTGGKPAFVNFPQDLLLNKVATIFPQKWLVVEVLEDVNPTKDIAESLLSLKEKGYRIALDDIEKKSETMKLANYADIIKVDFMTTTEEERIEIAQVSRQKGCLLLAEKVETREEHEWALQNNYDLFQGYFFCKPTLQHSTDIPSIPAVMISIYNELNKEEPDFSSIANMIMNDVSFSYKFLKYVNSPFLGVSSEITSIKQAITLVGVKDLQKWVSVIALSAITSNSKPDITLMALIRALFSSLYAERFGDKKRSSEYFMIGLFSFLDVLLGRDIKEILVDLPLSSRIVNTLSGEQTEERKVLDLAISYEKGEWDKVDRTAEEVDSSSLQEIYYDACQYAEDLVTQ